VIARPIVRGAVAATAISVVACATAQASTLTVKVDPPAAGTAQTPQAHTTSIALDKIDQGSDGNAKSAPVTLTEHFPADFAVALGSYATCPSAKVVHGDKKPDCPESSIVGTASGSAYVPALLFRTTSDQGYIYKLSDQAVRAWIHFSSPQQVGVIVNGTFAKGSAPFGPTITWDFKAIGSGAEAGVEVRVNSVAFVWTQHTANGAGQAAAPSTTSERARAKRARAQCSRRARRIRDRGKRQRALRHCAKAKPKPKAKTAPAPAPAPQATQGQTYSGVMSTGCTSGSWPFRAQMSFADGTSETADATVACSGAPPPPPSPAPSPPAPGSPLCPPICAVPASAGTAGRHRFGRSVPLGVRRPRSFPPSVPGLGRSVSAVFSSRGRGVMRGERLR
jgi:hypothetical protein